MSELAARFRAARAYADLTQLELAQALGIDVQTVKRREASKGDPKRAELIAIASITGVPETFMLDGFNWSYEKKLRVPPEDGADREPPGEIGRRARGSKPTPARKKPARKKKAQDA